MECPNCGAEIADTSKFCKKCGEKIENPIKICPKCQTKVSNDSTFCDSCGYNFEGVTTSTAQVVQMETSRTLELVLGILGAIFGFIGSIIAFFLSAFAPGLAALGISAFLASLVGLIGAIYVRNNAKKGGIVLIVAAVWLLISISLYGVLGFILLLVAGICAVFRK